MGESNAIRKEFGNFSGAKWGSGPLETMPSQHVYAMSGKYGFAYGNGQFRPLISVTGSGISLSYSLIFLGFSI